jgi:hypothetical protein
VIWLEATLVPVPAPRAPEAVPTFMPACVNNASVLLTVKVMVMVSPGATVV